MYDSRTLFLIDWDDTILPTSWLRSGGYLAGTVVEMETSPKLRPIPASVAADLLQIEARALALVEAAERLGTVVFVTNSSSQWIPFTMNRFFPTMLALAMGRFEAHSARPAEVEQAASLRSVIYLPAMGVNWKCVKFRKLADRAQFTNFISVGDGQAERTAVLALKDKGCAKAVRFDAQPDMALMVDQLAHLRRYLDDIVSDSRSGDVILYNDGFVIELLLDENAVPSPEKPN